MSQDYFDYWVRERLKEGICRVLFESLKRVFWEIIERFFRDYWEFLRDYREYFEKVKRDYKERSRVKKFQGYLDFEQNVRKFWL